MAELERYLRWRVGLMIEPSGMVEIYYFILLYEQESKQTFNRLGLFQPLLYFKYTTFL